MIRSELVLGLPDYEITDIQVLGGAIHISARYTGPISCPHCGRDRLRNKGRYVRRVERDSTAARWFGNVDGATPDGDELWQSR